MLDLLIDNFDKVAQSESYKISKLYTISEKFDGTKLSIYRKDTDFNYEDKLSNFIISYKRTIIDHEDNCGNYNERQKIREVSIGDAQYALVQDQINKSEKLEFLPRGVEFFCEFIMRKPTLTRTYIRYHAIVLIGYAEAEVIIVPGMITSFPKKMEYDNIEHYADLFRFDYPEEYVLDVNISSKDEYYEFKQDLLKTRSKYGGKVEGFVLKDTYGNIFKIVQDDQYDKEYRAKIKLQYLMEPEREAAYFLKLKEIANNRLNDMETLLQYSTWSPIYAISIIAYQWELPDITHDKKSEFQIREDYSHVLKYLYYKRLPENKNALIIGRFQPPTKAHFDMIREALSTHNNVTVAIVKTKNSIDFPFDLQCEIFKNAFPDIEIIRVKTGSIMAAMNKSTHVIQSVYCGTDRYETYASQLKSNPEINLIEVARTNTISATNLRLGLEMNNKQLFEDNADESAYQYFDTLKHHYDNYLEIQKESIWHGWIVSFDENKIYCQLRKELHEDKELKFSIKTLNKKQKESIAKGLIVKYDITKMKIYFMNEDAKWF